MLARAFQEPERVDLLPAGLVPLLGSVGAVVAHRPEKWYETGWEKVDALRFLEDPDHAEGSRTMAQASIQWLLAHDEVASVTPTFRTTDDIDEWAAAPDTPALSDAEMDRVEELYQDNFGIDRDDGMDALRSSVGGDDLEGTEMKSAGD